MNQVMVNRAKRLNARLQNRRDILLKIPAVQLIYRTSEELGNIDATHKAAAVAYFAILSIFPLLLGLTALFGFFLPSLNLQGELLTFVGNNLPGATDILKENIVTTVQLRSVMGFLSILLFFWSGSTMFSVVSVVINRA